MKGYVLTRPFSNMGGGQSEWTFAHKNGTEFFLKRFLTPTYPVDGGPGSAKSKEGKRIRCARFEDHHQTVQRLLLPLSKSGGNLVVTRDFFRVDAHYFKATDKVDDARLSLQQIARLPLEDKASLMITVCASLVILHRERIVHGDLKPDNVLVSNGASRSTYAAKLIDFDNCFQSGAPPGPEDLVGDPTYYSPEMMFYLSDGSAASRAAITQASDVFALALMFSQFLTGGLPTAGRPGYLADSLLQGSGLALPEIPAGAGAIGRLIRDMTAVRPADRPDVGEVATVLRAARRELRGLPSSSAFSTPGRLRGRGLEPPRLKGSLVPGDVGAGGGGGTPAPRTGLVTPRPYHEDAEGGSGKKA